jgi:hypothetical protein
MREHDLADVRLNDPRDRERVAGRLKHDPIVRAETLREQLQLAGRAATRPARRALPPSEIATSQKSRCTSNPMKRIQPLPSLAGPGRRGGRTTRTDPCSQSGQVAGAARYTHGLAAHKSDRPARPAFSLEAPVPETRRRYRPRRTPRSEASRLILMPVHHAMGRDRHATSSHRGGRSGSARERETTGIGRAAEAARLYKRWSRWSAKQAVRNGLTGGGGLSWCDAAGVGLCAIRLGRG